MTASRAYIVALVLLIIGGIGFALRASPPPHAETAQSDAAADEARLPQVPPRTLSFVDDDTESASQSAPISLPRLEESVRNFFTPTANDPETAGLHAYGNALGNELQIFANAHPDIVGTLKRHADARADAGAAAAVAKLADDYGAFGGMIARIDAPEIARADTAALAEAYRILGEKLRIIASTNNDAEFLAAIDAENKSADALVRVLVSISTTFKLHEVTFAPSEAGYVFEEGR